jgi:hypothetical protein
MGAAQGDGVPGRAGDRAGMQALLGFTSEARWLRYARVHLRGMFPLLPQQPGYNKRLRALAATMAG